MVRDISVSSEPAVEAEGMLRAGTDCCAVRCWLHTCASSCCSSCMQMLEERPTNCLYSSMSWKVA